MIKLSYLALPVLFGWLLFTGAVHVQHSSAPNIDGALLVLSELEGLETTPPVSGSSVPLATRHAKKSPRSLLMGSWKDGKTESLRRMSSDRDVLLKEAENDLEKQKREKNEDQSTTKDR